MKRELRLTGDGSHTVYLNELDEPYHSVHGAVQESMHVFIKQGFHEVRKSSLRILEMGLGTGLNLILTLLESEKLGIDVYYHAVEKYPLIPSEFSILNFEKVLACKPIGNLLKMHEAPWEEDFALTKNFHIHKQKADFKSMNPNGKFDLVYFDAFAPAKQPQLWTAEIFLKLYNLMKPEAILVTYTSKGSVRRTLISCGFDVVKLPGPPGKLEMIRAVKR